MPKLSKSQADLLHSLLEGPLPHNALSRDIIALVKHLGSMEERSHDKLLFTMGPERRTFPRPKNKHMTQQELSELRHFLQTYHVSESATENGEVVKPEGTTIVVIDHHKARFYRTTNNSQPERAGATAPYDPHGFHRHLIHRKEANYIGDRVPEDPKFYKDIAQVLKDSSSIIIIGHGSGKSNAAAYLVDYLGNNHPDITDRIVALETADLSALTEPQIEALAKRERNEECRSNALQTTFRPEAMASILQEQDRQAVGEGKGGDRKQG